MRYFRKKSMTSPPFWRLSYLEIHWLSSVLGTEYDNHVFFEDVILLQSTNIACCVFTKLTKV